MMSSTAAAFLVALVASAALVAPAAAAEASTVVGNVTMTGNVASPPDKTKLCAAIVSSAKVALSTCSLTVADGATAGTVDIAYVLALADAAAATAAKKNVDAIAGSFATLLMFSFPSTYSGAKITTGLAAPVAGAPAAAAATDVSGATKSAVASAALLVASAVAFLA